MRNSYLTILLCLFYSSIFSRELETTLNLDSLKNELISTTDSNKSFEINNQIGSLYSKNKRDSAVIYFENALKISRLNNWDVKSAKIMSELGEIYRIIYKTDKSEELLLNSREIFIEHELKTDLAYVLFRLGTLYDNQDKLSKAIEYINKSIEIGEELNDTTFLSKAYNNIGKAYQTIGLYEKASQFHYKSLRLKERSNDKDLPIAYSNIGLTYLNLKNTDKAMSFFKSANKIFVRDNRHIETAITSRNIGHLYVMKNKLDSAKIYYDLAYKCLKKIKDPNAESRYFSFMGHIYQKKGDSDKAIKSFNRSIDKFPKNGGNNTLLFSVNSSLYDIYFSKASNSKDNNNYIKHCILHGKEIESIANKLKSIKMTFEATQKLYKSYLKTNNTSEALKYAQKYIAAKDSLFNKQKHTTISNLNTKYETEKKEQQIDYQKKQIYLNEEMIKSEKTINNFLIIGFIIILVLSLIIYYNFTQKRKANQKLKELDSFKEDMTKMMVHDLKNPLSTILNADMASDSSHSFELIKNSGYKMMNLVQNILDVYKYENSEMQLNKENISAYNVAHRALNEVEFNATLKSIKLEKTIDKNIFIKADNEILHRVIANILSNAVKFSPSNNQITIKANIDNDQLKIEIHNNGSYISTENLSAIFDRFAQIEKKKQGKLNSTGLGLTFCKIAIEAHNGKIGVKSDKVTGTTFWFTIPDAFIHEYTESVNESDFSKNEKTELSKKDKEELKAFYERLNNIKVYEITDFYEIFDSIKNNKKGNQIWRTSVESTVYNSQQEEYDKLIKLIIS